VDSVESQQTDNAPLIYERKIEKSASDRQETSETKKGKGDFRSEKKKESFRMCCLGILHLCFDAV